MVIGVVCGIFSHLNRLLYLAKRVDPKAVLKLSAEKKQSLVFVISDAIYTHSLSVSLDEDIGVQRFNAEGKNSFTETKSLI